MVNKYPRHFDTKVLQNILLYGYIIIFSKSLNTNLELRHIKKYYIIYTVGRGAEGGNLKKVIYLIDLNLLQQPVSFLFF
jgi:hypothetical protein